MYTEIFSFYFFSSELCWGKAMVAYTMPQRRKKEESEGLKGERNACSKVLYLIRASKSMLIE